MDCANVSCDTLRYEVFPAKLVTSFVKITLEEKCSEGGIGGFREIRALTVTHDGEAAESVEQVEGVREYMRELIIRFRTML